MPLARAPIREFATEGDIEKYGPERAAELARERTEKLADLKQRVRDAGLPVFDYPTRWDAGRQGLVGLEEFGEAVYHDLLASIDDEFGTEPTAELDWFAEESAAMEAFIEERTERYVVGSRQALLDEMAAFAAGSREPSVLVVTGEPGSGKSALLGRFYRDHAAADADEIVIPHFVGASQGSTSIRLTLRRLCHELAQAAGIEDEIPEDIRELVQAFPEFLQRAAGGLEARPTDGRRVVLTIDALNQLDATDNAHALNWLPRQLPEGVRIICSSLEHPALEALRRRAQQLRELVCAPLTEADAAAIMDGVLARYRKRFDEAQRQALLAKQDAGNPLYLLAALEELRTDRK
ncbi:MAG: AAA family ATPase, partial [Armatimonadota bacterium]